MLGQKDPRSFDLVARQDVAGRRRVPAEMEEAEGFAFDFVALVGPCDLAFVEVPVSDVPTRLSHDLTVEHSGNEIDPPLVDEAHVACVVARFAQQTLLPVVEERPGLMSHRDETEVVDA